MLRDTDDHPYQPDSILGSHSAEQALARELLGLYYPMDLRASLTQIAQANGTAWQIEGHDASPQQTIAYFLGQEIACQFWRSSNVVNPVTPFVGIERLSAPLLSESVETPHVLLVGCAGSESYMLEQHMLERLNISPATHWTVDISPLPLARIAKTSPHARLFAELDPITQANLLTGAACQYQPLLHADAAKTPFTDGMFDLVITDLFFGSDSLPAEQRILQEIARVVKKGGRLIMKASVMNDDHVTKMIGLTTAIGTWWENSMMRTYGQHAGRDNYIGLTSEQWLELGQLYGKFIQTTYFGKNRFASSQAIGSFLEESGAFRIQEQAETKVRLGIPSAIPMHYATTIAERI